MALIDSIIVLISTLLGSLAGLGGGVIIKPMLDIVGFHDISSISFFSSCAVLSMAVYSIFRQLKNGVKFDWKMISYIGIGAILGGNIGSQLFSYVLNSFDETLVKMVQALILALLLTLTIIIINKEITFSINKKSVYVLVGISLGIISSFLGIGGGPINVAVFVMFFSIDIKRATVFSLATILFSQISKLMTIFLTTGFQSYDCEILLWVIPTAILGGMIGSYFNKISSEKVIKRVFSITVTFIIFINIYIVISHI
ncbi:MAG: sulfite exporter TauE/SafE family protein [Coprobacillus sp.]